MNESVAIILARGGSKRIPNKNIKFFEGEPIINYSIRAAIQSRCFDRVIVSTDDQQIANISEKAGAEIPFYRSKKNSNDEATTSNALVEVINRLDKIYDSFCCIYPTSPLINYENLIYAKKTLLKNNMIDGVIPVCEFSHSPQRSLIKSGDLIKMRYKSWVNTRTQDLQSQYHDAGQFYFLNTKRFLETKNLWNLKLSPLILPESEVQDIDNEIDWEIAKIKFKITKNES